MPRMFVLSYLRHILVNYFCQLSFPFFYIPLPSRGVLAKACFTRIFLQTTPCRRIVASEDGGGLRANSGPCDILPSAYRTTPAGDRRGQWAFAGDVLETSGVALLFDRT